MKPSRLTKLTDAHHASLCQIKTAAQTLESDLTNLLAGGPKGIAASRRQLKSALRRHDKITAALVAEITD